MISTRLHGMIDYAVAAVFGRLALSSALPVTARATLGAAGTYHAAYSALTDYEAGVYPALTMRQHLALDSVGAAALLGAGLLIRRQSARSSSLLLTAGLLECMIIARSSARRCSGPRSGTGLLGRLLAFDTTPEDQVSDPPLDTLKPVAAGLFVVDSVMHGPLGLPIPVRMTVIRLPGGELLLHSPTRLTPVLKKALDQLGPVRHLIAPNVVHWTFLGPWQQAYPDAVTWAAPNLQARRQVQRSGLRLDHELSETAPPGWDGIVLVIVPGGLGFREVALFHMPSSTLVLTDFVLNIRPDQVPASVRPIAKALGLAGGKGEPPVYLRAIIALRRRAAAEAAGRLIALRPQRVIFAHGPWFSGNGTEALRAATRWLERDGLRRNRRKA
ncbi:MAG: DUF4336 domain-containing protein [Acetobacteraceae bacterium]|nr:DUF4336 domain-containing protein [Acetobacteraceae bacterium]